MWLFFKCQYNSVTEKWAKIFREGPLLSKDGVGKKAFLPELARLVAD